MHLTHNVDAHYRRDARLVIRNTPSSMFTPDERLELAAMLKKQQQHFESMEKNIELLRDLMFEVSMLFDELDELNQYDRNTIKQFPMVLLEISENQMSLEAKIEDLEQSASTLSLEITKARKEHNLHRRLVENYILKRARIDGSHKSHGESM
jgi:hypothetical protein